MPVCPEYVEDVISAGYLRLQYVYLEFVLEMCPSRDGGEQEVSRADFAVYDNIPLNRADSIDDFWKAVCVVHSAPVDNPDGVALLLGFPASAFELGFVELAFRKLAPLALLTEHYDFTHLLP